MSELLSAINDQMSKLVEDALPSLVRLSNGRSGHGAGTIWHPKGLILTNAHVVQRRAPEVTLWDGRTYPSRLLYIDDKRDLAALAIEAVNLPVISLGSSNAVRSGQWVVALGHPWGVTGAGSAGMIIDIGEPPELSWYPSDLIQTGLQLRPGHSGGTSAPERGPEAAQRSRRVELRALAGRLRR